jgi:thiamine monophosphate synthase
VDLQPELDFVQVIAGLQNFDAQKVAAVVTAAEKGGATHVDIACDAALVKLATSLTTLPVCVSSVVPEDFVAAVEAGAHMIELGNYDSFYESGRVFAASEILELTKRTRELLPTITLSVTVPHTLPLDEQVSLAEKLEVLGADIIQTEGGTSASPVSPGIQGLIEKASPTLAAAYAISKAVRIPVMCASGISAVTAPMACGAGAAGVGVGSAVNKLNDQIGMVAAVRSIADSLSLPAQSSVSSPSAPSASAVAQ